jgi:NAD(P)-dependent dehydrogenase (short-subunit alcohol dehydrogenase family)
MSSAPDTSFDLTGRVALVTGGSRGIGKAIVMKLAAWGATPIIIARSTDAAERAARSIPGAHGLACDVADAAAVARLAADVPRADILVNNAGVAPPPAPIEETSEESWDRTLAVNLKGPFLMCRAFVPAMKRAGRGRIINIGSTAAHVTFNKLIPYAASKGGLVSFTRMLAMELAASGITVNAVLPGPVATDLFNETIPAAKIVTLTSAVPIGRLGLPEEIAASVAFLASDAAAWITGESLIVGGGLPGRRIG